MIMSYVKCNTVANAVGSIIMVQDRKELFTGCCFGPFRHMGKVPQSRCTCILWDLYFPGKFGGSEFDH